MATAAWCCTGKVYPYMDDGVAPPRLDRADRKAVVVEVVESETLSTEAKAQGGRAARLWNDKSKECCCLSGNKCLAENAMCGLEGNSVRIRCSSLGR
jgi:hypothetical protein